MSLDACASIVARGDPDRYSAALAAPLAARRVLLPLYAFNVEVARAPWVTAEPMIAEMRLQWWRDVLDEIASGGPVRRHEVAQPLAQVLDPEGAGALGDVTTARLRDTLPVPFEDAAELSRYLDMTAGTLAWTAARLLGSSDGENAVRQIAWAGGLANYLLAVPQLMARGRRPLPDPSPGAIRDLAAEGLSRLARSRPPRAAAPALLCTWRARSLLRQALRHPERVAGDGLRQSEFSRRAGLLWKALTV